MKKQLIISVILLLISKFSVYAQNQQWFTYTDGRPVSEIKEHNGTYWISTLGGLVYFTDPAEVYHLDQSNSPINTNKFSAMEMDSNGGLWLGTMDGDIYSYIDGQWKFYSDVGKRKHSVLRVSKIIVDQNNEVWFTRRYMDPPKDKPKTTGITARAFGEDYELVKIIGGKFVRQETKATSVYDMSLGLDNSLLLATDKGLKLKHNRIEDIDLPSDADVSQPYKVLQDGEGNYYVSSGRWTWKSMEGEWVVQEIYKSGDKIFSIPAERFDVVNGNEVVIGTSGEVFVGKAGSWSQLDKAKLKEKFGKNVYLEWTYVTQKGELFANTRYGLLWIKEDDVVVINPSNSDLRGSFVHNLHIDDNNTIYFKSDGLSFTIEEEEWTSTRLEHYGLPPAFRALPKEARELLGDYILKGLKSHFNKMVTSSNGTIWIPTSKGLVEYFRGEIQLHTSSNSELPSTRIFGIGISPQNVIWLGLDSGVVEWNNQGLIYHALESRYSGAQYKNIEFHTDGRVFVSGRHGFHIYNGKNWEYINEGLPRNSINAMAVDMNGTLWLGTYGSGLVRYDENGIKIISTEGTGLSSNSIHGVDVDQYNNIWLGTQDGLCVYNEAGLVGQVAKDGSSSYYQIQPNSPYSVSTKSNGKDTTNLELRFSNTDMLFTQLNLFPNPTAGQFTVEVVAAKPIEVDYLLFDLKGRLIQEQKASGQNQVVRMDLSGEAAGTYILRIKQGQVVISERIIKL